VSDLQKWDKNLGALALTSFVGHFPLFSDALLRMSLQNVAL